MNTKRITTFASPLHVIGRDPLLTYQVVTAIADRDRRNQMGLSQKYSKKYGHSFCRSTRRPVTAPEVDGEALDPS